MKIRNLAVMLTGTAALALGGLAQADSADVVTIVDESGSMSTEHGWLGGMIVDLEAGIVGAGVGDTADGDDPNQYGLIGFGRSGSSVPPRQIDVGGDQFGTAAEFDTATSNLVLSGFIEDGYAGIDFFRNNYTPTGDATNLILVTDEDRDVNFGYGGVTYASTLQYLTDNDILLNAVVNSSFRCGDGTTVALGIDSSGNGYVADGSGGFTTCTGATAITGSSNTFGTTITDYVNLALATGGAAWDLNQLRSGGNDALSFTAAFVDIKVKEIIEQVDDTPVPEPGTLALLGASLLGFAATRRRKSV